MELRIDHASADRNSRNVIFSVRRFTALAMVAVAGGNTSGLIQSASFRPRILNAASRYGNVVNRDSNQISTIAEHFAALDQSLCNDFQSTR